MKKLNWNDVTVQQFIDIQKLARQDGIDEIELSEKAVAIMYDMTERQVEELSISEFNRRSKEIVFVLGNEIIQGKPMKVIKANGNKYAIEYDPSKLKHRQYVEIMTWSGESMIDNMHLIMASLVCPVNRLGIKLKNRAEHHQKIAEDILQAKIVDIYHSCVFFCKLYLASMRSIRDYLIIEMMKQGATRQQATNLFDISLSALDGSITPKKLRSLKG